jgi:outer membrane protein OmpA-like peptidoglycan-associated protein
MLKTTLGVRYSFGDMKHIDRERAYLAINDMLKEDMMRSLNYWKQNFQDTIDMLRKELHLAIKAAQYSRPSIIDVAFIPRRSADQSDSVRIVFSDMSSETKAISTGAALLSSTPDSSSSAKSVEQLRELVKLERNVIGFATGQTSLNAEGRSIANRISTAMNQDSSLIVTVIGHTDDVSSEAVNMRISISRAQNVADYLIENGIAADRITVVGKGETEPLLNQQTETARRINRRVEFKFIPDQQ